VTMCAPTDRAGATVAIWPCVLVVEPKARAKSMPELLGRRHNVPCCDVGYSHGPADDQSHLDSGHGTACMYAVSGRRKVVATNANVKCICGRSRSRPRFAGCDDKPVEMEADGSRVCLEMVRKSTRQSRRGHGPEKLVQLHAMSRAND
jgi:hypothetical protein